MAGLRAFYEGEHPRAGTELVLDPLEGKHLARVLRARPGEIVEILNGKGAVTQATFLGQSGKDAVLKVEATKHFSKPRPAITLLQAVPKGKTFDTILRQAAEIGIAAVIPILSERSEVRLSSDRLTRKQEHWQAILREAGKQSGNPWFPELGEATDLPSALESNSYALGIVASLETGSQPLITCLMAQNRPHEVLLAVGPEGDFTAEEYTLLRQKGLQAVRLGHQVLKCDTAALYLSGAIDACFYPRIPKQEC